MEPQVFYSDDFTDKKSILRGDNTYLWNYNY